MNSDNSDRRCIVALTGFMASGKSAVGRALAELLAWHFVDLDAAIEQREQVAIRDIFAQRGEAEFRRVERETLAEVLGSSSHPTVFALGGGTFVQPENQVMLKRPPVKTVYLEVPLDELLRRCQTQHASGPENPRPLAQDPVAFRRLYEERLPLYRLADITVDAHSGVAEEVARAIAGILRLTPPAN